MCFASGVWGGSLPRPGFLRWRRGRGINAPPWTNTRSARSARWPAAHVSLAPTAGSAWSQRPGTVRDRERPPLRHTHTPRDGEPELEGDREKQREKDMQRDAKDLERQ